MTRATEIGHKLNLKWKLVYNFQMFGETRDTCVVAVVLWLLLLFILLLLV